MTRNVYEIKGQLIQARFADLGSTHRANEFAPTEVQFILCAFLMLGRAGSETSFAYSSKVIVFVFNKKSL